MKYGIFVSVFFASITTTIRSQSPPPPWLELLPAEWSHLFNLHTRGSFANVLLLSEDLKTWKHYRSILSRIPVFPYVNDHSLPGKTRFYRIRSADSLSHRVLLQQWQSLGYRN